MDLPLPFFLEAFPVFKLATVFNPALQISATAVRVWKWGMVLWKVKLGLFAKEAAMSGFRLPSSMSFFRLVVPPQLQSIGMFCFSVSKVKNRKV
jgi:hypothetical protein